MNLKGAEPRGWMGFQGSAQRAQYIRKILEIVLWMLVSCQVYIPQLECIPLSGRGWIFLLV